MKRRKRTVSFARMTAFWVASDRAPIRVVVLNVDAMPCPDTGRRNVLERMNTGLILSPFGLLLLPRRFVVWEQVRNDQRIRVDGVSRPTNVHHESRLPRFVHVVPRRSTTTGARTWAIVWLAFMTNAIVVWHLSTPRFVRCHWRPLYFLYRSEVHIRNAQRPPVHWRCAHVRVTPERMHEGSGRTGHCTHRGPADERHGQPQAVLCGSS